MLVGKVSCELSERTYGTEEWWVLVEKEGADTTDAACCWAAWAWAWAWVGVGVRGVAEPWV